jgi:hypothetical protein
VFKIVAEPWLLLFVLSTAPTLLYSILPLTSLMGGSLWFKCLANIFRPFQFFLLTSIEVNLILGYYKEFNVSIRYFLTTWPQFFYVFSILIIRLWKSSILKKFLLFWSFGCLTWLIDTYKILLFAFMPKSTNSPNW